MSKLPVIVTRGLPGTRETVRHLAEVGFAPILSPVLVFKVLSPPHDLDLAGTTGLIFTSANGVRFFAERWKSRNFTAWCVGNTTHAAATEAGFTTCHNADGDAEDLRQLIIDKSAPENGRLVHVANEAAAGNLAARLRNAGFKVDFAPLYTARPAASLSNEALSTLRSEPRGIVMIHSAKGAEAFARLAVGQVPQGWALVAISNRSAAPLAHFDWTSTHIAHHPSENGAVEAALAARETL